MFIVSKKKWLAGPGLVLVSSIFSIAQADENAISDADDAFGITTGQESIGIYNEGSVRGFDLSSAGNYRINGTYFVKSSGVSSFFLKKTNVKIGYGGLGTAFIGPSGVIDFILRDPAEGEANTIKLGFESYYTPVVDILFKGRSEDNLYSYSVGLGLETEARDKQGGTGKSTLLAGTFRYSPSKDTKIQLFGGEYDYSRNGGFNVSLSPDATHLPNRIKRQEYLGQDWAIEKGQRRIAGVLIDSRVSHNWKLGATAVFSQDDPTTAYTQLFSNLTDDGNVDVDYVISPHQKFTAWSGEFRATWQSKGAVLEQQIHAVLRGRLSKNNFGGEQVVHLGEANLGQLMQPVTAQQFNQFKTNLNDEIQQVGAGVSYSALVYNKLRIDIGLLYTDYQKVFTTANGIEHENTNSPLLYNWNLLYPVTSKVKLYASYTRGLEESGIAPSSAANRNAVLPAGIATQREVGLHYKITPKVNAIVGAFRTSRPYAGVNHANDYYQHLGIVTHQGVELSIVGNISPSISMIAGGVYTDASIHAEAFDDNTLGQRPVGVPKWKLISNIMFNPESLPNLSLDIGATYIGKRAARSSIQLDNPEQLTLPSSFTVNAGARYSFGAGRQKPALRLQVLNLLNGYDWNVSSSETLTYSDPRSVRLLLTVSF